MLKNRDLFTTVLFLAVLGAAASVWILPVPAARAAELWVGTEAGDYPTIQAAVNAAAPGDTIVVRDGAYSEDLVVDKKVHLTPAFGARVIIDGDITLTETAGGAELLGLELAAGKKIVAANGIDWQDGVPADARNRVVFLGARSGTALEVELQDIVSHRDFDLYGGAWIHALGEGTLITHTGIIDVSSAVGLNVRGFEWETGDRARATLGSVYVTSRDTGIGGFFITANQSQLVVNGEIVAKTLGDDSYASGLNVRGSSGVTAQFSDITVEGGRLALGVDFNVAGDAVLGHSGLIEAVARDAGSTVHGVEIGAADNSSLTVGDVSVEAGALARGVTTTYLPGSLIVTDGLTNDVSLHVGGVFAVARDQDSQAYGIDIGGLDRVSLTAGEVEVRADQLARGVWLRFGDEGSVHLIGGVTATSFSGSAQGLYVQAGDGFFASVGDVAVEGAKGAVQGVFFNAGDEGELAHAGLIRVTGTTSEALARGLNLVAGERFSGFVGDVTVVAPVDALGVSLTAQDESYFAAPGTITVAANGAGGRAGGVSVLAVDGLTIDAGRIVAVAEGNGGSATGASLVAQDGLDATFASLSATASSLAAGLTFAVRDDAAVRADDVSAVTSAGAGRALGVNFDAGSRAHLSAGSVTARSSGRDSEATGISGVAGGEFTAVVGDVAASAGMEAIGLYLQAGEGANVTQSGAMTATSSADGGLAAGAVFLAGSALAVDADRLEAVATGADTEAVGAYIGAGDDIRAVFTSLNAAAGADAAALFVSALDEVTLSAGVASAVSSDDAGVARGVQVHLAAGGELSFGSVAAQSLGDRSVAYGLNAAVGDFFSATLGDVAVDAGLAAWGVALAAGENATVHAGRIESTGRGAGAMSYGAYVTGTHALTVDLDEIVSGAALEAFGLYVDAGNDLSARAGDVAAIAEGAGSAAGNAVGMLVDAGERVRVDVGRVQAVAPGGSGQASGLQAVAAGALSVNAGAIDVQAGESAWGIQADSGRELTLDLGSVKVDADRFAYGVLAGGATSTVTVNERISAGAGEIARGLVVKEGDATVTSRGHVLAEADDSVAVQFGAATAAGHVTFQNLGTVAASGRSGAAVLVHVTGGAAVQNEGTIASGTGLAFYAQDSTGSVTFDNAGEVTGSVVLGQGDDVLTLTANARIDGAVHLGAGDDAATLHYGSLVTGLLDGGAGDDTLTLLGTAASALPEGSTWNGLAARDIEQAWVHGGAWLLSGGTAIRAAEVYDAYLRIDDDVAISDLTLAGGALVGEGHLTGNVTNAGGVVSPGGSYGILTITGSYTQGPDGVLYMEVDGSAPPEAGVTYDQLVIVGGTATFEDGTTVQVRPVFSGRVPSRAEFTIVDGDVRFDPDAIRLDLQLPPSLFLDGWLEEGSMKLVLAVVPFDSVAETPNQKALSDALSEAADDPDTDLDDLYDWLVGLGPEEADKARDAYDSLSGEAYTHLPTLWSRRLDVASRAAIHAVAHPFPGPLKQVWAVPYSESGQIAAGADVAGSRFQLQGIVAGIDLITAPGSRLGLSVGAGREWLSMDARASEIEGQGYQAGVYGVLSLDRIRLTALLGYNSTAYQSRRDVVFGDVHHGTTGRFTATGVAVAAEARYNLAASPSVRIEPFASLGYYRTVLKTITEEGAGTLGLIVDSRDAIGWRGRVGIELTADTWSAGSLSIRPHVRLAWVSDVAADDRVMTARLQGAKDYPFTIRGVAAERSGIEASFGLGGELGPRTTWGLDYTGFFRTDMKSHLITARIAFTF